MSAHAYKRFNCLESNLCKPLPRLLMMLIYSDYYSHITSASLPAPLIDHLLTKAQWKPFDSTILLSPPVTSPGNRRNRFRSQYGSQADED